MLNEQEHLRKANSNKSFLDLTKGLDYNDWTIVVCFYVQLHYISAYLRKCGVNYAIESHRAREKAIINIISRKSSGWTQLREVLPKYNEAYAWSRKARYNSDSNMKNDVSHKKLNEFMTDTKVEIPRKLSYS